jgi:hypothetical protein
MQAMVGSSGRPRRLPKPRIVKASVEIARELSTEWQGLGPTIRRRVEALLDGTSTRGREGAYIVAVPLPKHFALDLARGGSRFRAAFPTLGRRVIGIDEAGDLVSIRVACEGCHAGPFFGLVAPTQRLVRFHVLHCLAVATGRVVEHRIDLDVRAILSQLTTRGVGLATP